MAYGRFIPRFPEKYVGDAENIMWRSSWEHRVMIWLDSRSAVEKWGSEEIKIAYIKPTDGQVHTYIPDFFAKIKDKDGVVKHWVIEIKPRHEAEEKYAKHERAKEALIVNNAKWKAAQIFCEQNGMEFLVLTEKSIFFQGVKRGKLPVHVQES